MRANYFAPWLALAAMILALVPAGLARAGPGVGERFRAYYDERQGVRVLGYPLTGLTEANGYVAQYFEEDGRGVLIDSLDIAPASRPQQPWTQAAHLEIRDAAGAVLASRSLTVLNPDDPDTREITLYWIVGENLKTELRRIPKTRALGTAAIEELLWGPGSRNTAGFTTAIPTPQEVLAYTGRTAEWGPRVMLRSLSLVDGVALADFSRELRAYGGGSLRGSQIHAQITSTLLQFAQVRDARITVEGQADRALEP